MFKIPTLEECWEKVNACEAFYAKEGVAPDGREYVVFNYRLASYEDFKNHDARELRGLMFLKDEKFGTWETFPMLPKFWNVNENEYTLYDNIKGWEVESIANKEDGSLIAFVPSVGDESILARTKMSFDNEQAKMAQELYKEKYGKEFAFVVLALYHDFDVILYFELVSPKNRIVLKYGESELRLISGRFRKSGEILSKESLEDIHNIFQDYGVPVKLAEHEENRSLEELLEERKHIENKEGWVIKFKNGDLVKLKTEWYVREHKIRDGLNFPNAIIEMVLNETIDDLLSELEPGSEERVFVEEIVEKVDHYFNHVVKYVEEKKKEYEEMGDRKEFALKNKDNPYFGLVMQALNKDTEEVVKNHISRETNKKEKAEKFLENISFH